MMILDPGEALGEGTTRLVFEHPDHSDRLIKVARPRYRERCDRVRHYLSQSGRYGSNKVFVKELGYYLGLAAKRPDLMSLFPWFYGFVDTSLGLGVVQQKITDDRGGIAPTLKALIDEDGLTDRHRTLAAELLDRFEQEHIVFSDFKPQNIAAEGPRDAPTRLVLIDGFGDPSMPPLRFSLPWYNRRFQRPRIAMLRRQLGIT
jgi:hypothetical protein